MSTHHQSRFLSRNFACVLVSAALLSGCSSTQRITNIEDVAGGHSYQAEYQAANYKDSQRVEPAAVEINASRCSPEAPVRKQPTFFAEELLSPGDLVFVSIGDDETFSGKYEISGDGTLKVRELVSVRAYGRTVFQLSEAVSKALAEANYYNTPPQVSVRLADYGAVRAFVGGAVFEPGVVTIGGTVATGNDNSRVETIGATTEARRLSSAIRNAGGARPDADLSRVEIKRNGKTMVVDLRNALKGGMFDDKIILAGDEVTVHSRGCFQQNLMAPSEVSPAGIKIFMSNLTEPAPSNSTSKIDKDTREIRYGTRMLQAIVSMNCVGGSKWTNANRSAVLYTRNPVSGQSVVLERNIEDLLRNANRDEFDPFLLPNDALACYDSRTTDVVKVAQGFGIVAGAVMLGRGF